MSRRSCLTCLCLGLALAGVRSLRANGIPEIDVNSSTGDVILNMHGMGTYGYEIDSNAHLIPANLDSLHAQNLVSNWEINDASTSTIVEGTVTNPPGGLFTSSSPIDLGDIVVPSAPHDLYLTYLNNNFDLFSGNVFYSAVPEPASLVLFGLGAIGLFAVARRPRF